MNQTSSGFLNSIPPVTRNPITINLLFWIVSLALLKVGIDLMDLLGPHFPGATSFKTYQIVSHMFMHGIHSFVHMFLNTFAVYMLGRVLESIWDPKRFLIFHFVTGIGAGLIQGVAWFFNLWDMIFANQNMISLNGAQVINKNKFLGYLVTIGASDAILKILLASAMVFLNVLLYLMFMPIPIKAKYFVIFYGPAKLFMSVVSPGGDMVTHSVHLGGMLFGYLLICYWKKKDADDGRYFCQLGACASVG